MLSFTFSLHTEQDQTKSGYLQWKDAESYRQITLH